MFNLLGDYIKAIYQLVKISYLNNTNNLIMIFVNYKVIQNE